MKKLSFRLVSRMRGKDFHTGTEELGLEYGHIVRHGYVTRWYEVLKSLVASVMLISLVAYVIFTYLGGYIICRYYSRPCIIAGRSLIFALNKVNTRYSNQNIHCILLELTQTLIAIAPSLFASEEQLRDVKVSKTKTTTPNHRDFTPQQVRYRPWSYSIYLGAPYCTGIEKQKI